jgi:hypothetical protein
VFELIKFQNFSSNPSNKSNFLHACWPETKRESIWNIKGRKLRYFSQWWDKHSKFVMFIRGQVDPEVKEPHVLTLEVLSFGFIIWLSAYFPYQPPKRIEVSSPWTKLT